MHADDPLDRLIGDCPAVASVRHEIQTAARSDAKVLITGETGVGKDIVARLIHGASRRSAAPFVPVNCAGVPETLLESELFGHARGSFTGAVRDRVGLLESAGRGTVFFDEVGEMSLRMQAVLLRFLESGEIQRVGVDRARGSLNVRCIAATHRDLVSEISAGTIRQDLYYRINVLRIVVPPLRERGDDVLLLLEHFLRRYSTEHGTSLSRLSCAAEKTLLAYSWPGNVRQLKNVAERLALHFSGQIIDDGDLPEEIIAASRSSLPSPAAKPAAANALRTVEAELLARMREGGESFWPGFHAPFVRHDVSRAHLQAIVAYGLRQTGGNYRHVVRLFNMEQRDYRRFLAFLQQHGCKVPFHPYRTASSQPVQGAEPLKAGWAPAARLARVG